MPNILVVDDDSNIRRLLRVTLGPTHHVDEASDGRAGLQQLLADPPALVLLDVAMPIMDGLAVCSVVRSEPTLARIGIIILSAYAGSDEALAAGAGHHFQKPFRPLELLTTIDELLGTRFAIVRQIN